MALNWCGRAWPPTRRCYASNHMLASVARIWVRDVSVLTEWCSMLAEKLRLLRHRAMLVIRVTKRGSVDGLLTSVHVFETGTCS